MTDILDDIVASKKEEVAVAKKIKPESVVRQEAFERDTQRPFLEGLRRSHRGGTGVIAEIKRASPSKGIIREDLKAGEYARKYVQGRAPAFYVLNVFRNI